MILRVIAILFIAGSLFAQPNDNSSQAKLDSNGNPQAATTPPHNGIAAKHDEATEESSRRWYTTFEKPDLVLVIIAMVTAFAVIYQAREMKRATEVMQRSTTEMEKQTGILVQYNRATRESADASIKSANALINSERAWLVPELQSVAIAKNGFWSYRHSGARLTDEELLAGKHQVYFLKLTNMGRTPAQISQFTISYTCLPESLRELPPNASGDITESHKFMHLLGSGDSIEISDPPIDIQKYMSDWDAIRNLEKTAVFHGWVKYRHMFSTTDDCYADFCYVYTVPLRRLSSVGRYTKQREERSKAGETAGEKAN